jgi:hypothetical protein
VLFLFGPLFVPFSAETTTVRGTRESIGRGAASSVLEREFPGVINRSEERVEMGGKNGKNTRNGGDD